MAYKNFPSGKCYCDIHRVTFVSGGSCPKCESGVSMPIHNDSQRLNNDSQKVSVPREARGFLERLHAYGRKFKAEVNWDLCSGRVVQLRNRVFYKQLDFDGAIVKVFYKSIVVRLRKNNDIVHENVREAEKMAYKRIYDVLQLLPKEVKVSESDIEAVHNAFMEHPIAKQYPNLKVYKDGMLRAWADNSHGKAEWEYGSPEFAISDSAYRESYESDLLSRPDLPSVQQAKIEHIVDVLDKYAVQMDKHLEVESKTSDTLSLIQRSLSSVSFPQEVLDNSNSPLFTPAVNTHMGVVGGIANKSQECSFGNGERGRVLAFDVPETISKSDVINKTKRYRLFRARQLLSQMGWGGQTW